MITDINIISRIRTPLWIPCVLIAITLAAIATSFIFMQRVEQMNARISAIDTSVSEKQAAFANWVDTDELEQDGNFRQKVGMR